VTGKTTQIEKVDERLRDLWSRRATLSAQEWETLYTLVYGILRPTYRDWLGQLGISPDESIQDFFEDKVFALSDRASSLDHAGALVVFYRNFLSSLGRDPYLKRRVVSDSDVGDIDASLAGMPQHVTSHQSAGVGSPDDSFSRQDLNDWIAAEVDALLPDRHSGGPTSQARDVVAQFLGVDLAHVTREAQDFLSGQGAWSHLAEQGDWIRLYLRCHLCPEQPDAVALSTLARKHDIPSYHHRAVKLGVTVPRQQDAALEAFRKSYRGQWLTSIGISIDLDHLTEVSLALKILCLVALKSQEPC